MTGRVTVAGLVLAVTALTLTGCTGDDAPAPPTTTTPPPTTSASPSPTPREPSLPAAAKKPTRAGAEAFFLHFWSIVNFSYTQTNPDPLRAASSPSCAFCSSLEKELQSARNANQRFVGGQITIRAAVAAPGRPRDGIVVNGIGDQSVGKRVSTDGQVVRSYPSQSRVRIDGETRWEGGRWRMAGVALLKQGES